MFALFGAVILFLSVYAVPAEVVSPVVPAIEETETALENAPVTLEIAPETTQTPEIGDVATPTLPIAESYLCRCVEYLRERWGVPIKGDAYLLKPNTGKIEPGIVVLFQLRERHVGLITKREGDVISGPESNRISCTETMWSIDLSDPAQTKKIVGFLDPLKATYTSSGMVK